MNNSKENLPTPLVDRLNPAKVKLKNRRSLTKSGSSKHTYHIVLDLQDAPLFFKVGDSIGIYPENDPLLVTHLIDAMKIDPEEIIQEPRSQQEMSVREFLTRKANLSRITSSFLKLFYEEIHSHDKKNTLRHLLSIENKPLLSQYLSMHDPLDLFQEFAEVKLSAQALCAQFSPLLPRFYSVASSQAVFPNEVHLTVALFTFHHGQERRYGVGSHFLCHLAQVDRTLIDAYVQPAKQFTLPSDDTLPIIMVGPGTGVAPFRAFIQERIHRGSKGLNWLFFGERNQATDFLYEEEWGSFVKEGHLKLDLAFSRDQEEKIYVQTRMYENANLLWQLLEQGAIFYVCGDAKHMAKDVEAMLSMIVSEQGDLDKEEAKAYIKHLKATKRYLTDVY